MKLGKTERKILAIINIKGSADENYIRKKLNRKSPIYKELNRLQDKRYIYVSRKRIGKPIQEYSITQKGRKTINPIKFKDVNEKASELFAIIQLIDEEEIDYSKHKTRIKKLIKELKPLENQYQKKNEHYYAIADDIELNIEMGNFDLIDYWDGYLSELTNEQQNTVIERNMFYWDKYKE